MDEQYNKLRFFITSPHACNYLADHEACSLFADPLFPKNKTLYTALVANGFRRSGEHLYRPYCNECSECVPVRISASQFKMNRNQKRAWMKNQDITVSESVAEYHAEHFELYKKYLSTRHANAGMDNPTESNYQDFLWASWSDTVLFEFRLKNKIVAVAVVDHLKQAFSAVYTFFDPDFSDRSLGKFAILYLIKQAQQLAYPWVYLGYWISDCSKMKYKIEYQPLECFIDDDWKKFNTISPNDFAVRQN